jgi:hypothetical protein
LQFSERGHCLVPRGSPLGSGTGRWSYCETWG